MAGYHPRMDRRAFIQQTLTVISGLVVGGVSIASKADEVVELRPFPLPCAEIGRPENCQEGIGFSPFHALEMIDGPGFFRLHPMGYNLVRRWSLSKHYKLESKGGMLTINGIGFVLDPSLPENGGIWTPEEGTPKKFRFSSAWMVRAPRGPGIIHR